MAGWIAAGASLVGDYMSMQGGQATNAQNMAMLQQSESFGERSTQQVQNWEAQQTAKAQAFAQKMSDTQMQRRVADLRAAGLNPALAYQQGGASAPIVGAPSSSAPGNPTGAPMQNPMQAFSQLGSQAASALQTNAQVAQTKAATENTQADTKLKISQTPTPNYITTTTNADGTTEVSVNAAAGHELGEQTLKNQQAVVNQINADIRQKDSVTDLNDAERELKGLEIGQVKALYDATVKAGLANLELDRITATSGKNVMGMTAKVPDKLPGVGGMNVNVGTWIEAMRLVIGASKGH